MFALGFAFSGWLYLLLAFSPSLALRDDLLTDNVVAWLYEIIHDEDVSQYYSPNAPFSPYGRNIVSGGSQRIRIWDVSGTQGSNEVRFFNFADIGHVVWALIVGGVGGLTASILWARQQRASQKDISQREDPPGEANE